MERNDSVAISQAFGERRHLNHPKNLYLSITNIPPKKKGFPVN
jgi:hypothetical protein